MEESDKNQCEVCGKDCEMLHGKGAFQGNKEERMMCEDCYEEVFGERP